MNVMLRILRIAVAALFSVTLVLFAFFYAKTEFVKDHTKPSIKIDKEIIEVPLNVTNKELLKGVTAYDKKDGDLTDKIIVESISKFTETGTCKVTYAVCDADNHVASATRKIKYKKYKHPQYYLTRSLCYSLYERVDIQSAIGAKDVLDGDISNNIVTTSSDFETGKVGLYSLKAKVANSKGDVVEVELPMIVEDRSLNSPQIELSKYLIYSKKGKDIDFKKYFKSAVDSVEKNVSGSLSIHSDFNKNKEGVYTVHYYVKDSLDRQGHSVLTVIVSK